MYVCCAVNYGVICAVLFVCFVSWLLCPCRQRAEALSDDARLTSVCLLIMRRSDNSPPRPSRLRQHLQEGQPVHETYYAQPLLVRGIKQRCCLMSVCLLRTSGLSRQQRPRKTEIGTEVAHITRDSDTTFKVKGQLAGGVAYCGGLPHTCRRCCCQSAVP